MCWSLCRIDKNFWCTRRYAGPPLLLLCLLLGLRRLRLLPAAVLRLLLGLALLLSLELLLGLELPLGLELLVVYLRG